MTIMPSATSAIGVLAACLLGLAPATCRADGDVRVGQLLPRRGDEILVCGQLYHTTAPVVLWMDPGGFDAYRTERRFAPLEEAPWRQPDPKGLRSPARYGLRKDPLSPDQLESVRGGGWNLRLLQQVVDQFVLHYDVCGTSKQCFKVLHDIRGLSVHFLLDLDGTIYQTLDLKERAFHATIANTRSVGIEIANIGAYRVGSRDPLSQWYQKDPDGRVRITVPKALGPTTWRDPAFIPRPFRHEPVVGVVQGKELQMYDFTPQQYDSLIKLTATLCTLFPKIKCDYPRDSAGKLIPHKLPDGELLRYQGVLGHYHVQTNKTDPGPAMQWDYVIESARKLMPAAPALTAPPR